MRPLAPPLATPRAYVVERRDEMLGELGVRPRELRVEGVRRHEQRPGEALSRLLVVIGAACLTGVDGVAVEAQRGDEAALGVVGLEDLDVRGVVDALGGQRGNAVAVDDRTHISVRPPRARLAPPPRRSRRVGQPVRLAG
jgi:hypothetical protein